MVNPINLGIFKPGAIVDFMWNTFTTLGSFTRSGNGTIRIYKNNSTAEALTPGATDTEDFDAMTGVHHCRIDTSIDASFYAAGNTYLVVIQGAVWNSNTYNLCIACFRLADSAAAENGAFVRGKAVAGTLSTTQMTCDLAETTNNHYRDRRLIWVSGALAGQEVQVTAFTGFSGGSSKLTYTAATEAPSVGDEFILV